MNSLKGKCRLGTFVSEEGIKTDPAKTDKIKMACPTRVGKLRSFLGFAGYYRRFVKGYSSIVKPLNDLLIGHSTHKVKKGQKRKQGTPWRWGDMEQQAFDSILEKLTSPPVLAYADYSQPLYCNNRCEY